MIDFLTQQVPSLGLPVRHSVAESREYLATVDDRVRPRIAGCLALLGEAELIPSTFKALTDQRLLPAMYAILEEGVPVNEALKEAQKMPRGTRNAEGFVAEGKEPQPAPQC